MRKKYTDKQLYQSTKQMVNDNSLSSSVCCLCQRCCALTFHHLIPRMLHRRKFYKKHYTKIMLSQGIYICRLCHNGLHALYSEKELAQYFDTLDKICSDAAINKHIEWVIKQKTGCY